MRWIAKSPPWLLITCLLTMPLWLHAKDLPEAADSISIFDDSKPPGLQARPMATQPAGTSKPAQLIALVDAEAARLHGYALRDGVLITHGHEAAHMSLPYAPGAEYDLDAQFARTAGKEAVAITFPVGRSSCTLCIGSNGNRDAWLGQINGVGAGKENPSRVPQPLVNNRRYRATIRVRHDGIAAYLDGQPLCEYRTDGHDVCGQRMFSARSSRLIAVGSFQSVVEFHSVDVTPVTGAGTIATDKAEDGRPINPLAVSARPDGAYELAAADATAHGPALAFQRSMHMSTVDGQPDENPNGLRNFGNWSEAKEYISWIVDVPKAGPFAVAITYACPPEESGSEMEVTFNAEGALAMTVEPTGAWNTFRRAAIGQAMIPAGKVTVALRAKTKAHKLVMDVERITLIPVQ